MEWTKTKVAHVHQPAWVQTQVPNTYVAIQQVDLELVEGWPEPMTVVLCDTSNDLAAAAGPAPGALGVCDPTHLGVAAVAAGATWDTSWSTMNGQTEGPPLSPDNGVWYFAGNFDERIGVMFACRANKTALGSGTQMLSATDYLPDAILDNVGMGFTTFNGNIEEDKLDYWWASPQGVAETASRPEHIHHVSGGVSGGTYVWESDTPGFSIPLAGLDEDERLWRLNAQNVPFTTNRFREVGPMIPSRIAHGRVSWDWLWHGTCAAGGLGNTNAWCLPAGHPRLAVDGVANGGSIFTDGVNCTCSMACPNEGTAMGEADGQVKYDFTHLSSFIADAYGPANAPATPYAGTTAAPISQQDVHPSQRAALRIMARTGPDADMPGFLGTACGATNHGVGSIDPSFYGEDIVPNVGRLGHALAGTAGYAHLVDADPALGVTAGFTGVETDPRVYSVDFGVIGADGEWTGGDGAPFISGAGANLATCVSGNNYDIDPTRWWAQILDNWMTAFPSTPLVGKVVYGANALDGAEGRCYVANEYVVGRRGTSFPLPASPYDPARPVPLTGYSGRQNGVRYDSWLAIDVRDRYWDFAESDYLRWSGAWKTTAYQAEIWYKLQNMTSFVRDMTPGGMASRVESYGYWDLDEAIRFSRARHFSIFNTKLDAFIPHLDLSTYQGSLPLDEQTLADGFCDCAPTPGSPCVAEAISELLRTTGFRIRRMSRALDTTAQANQPFTVKLWLANAGNAPPHGDYSLEFGIATRGANFDPLSTSLPLKYAMHATYPRMSRGPKAGSNLATRLSTSTISFDPTTLLPYDEVDPPVRANYSGQCATYQNDGTKCLEADGGKQRSAVKFQTPASNATYTAHFDSGVQQRDISITTDTNATGNEAATAFVQAVAADGVVSGWFTGVVENINVAKLTARSGGLAYALTGDPNNPIGLSITLPVPAVVAGDAVTYGTQEASAWICGFVDCAIPSTKSYRIEGSFTLPAGNYVMLYRFRDNQSDKPVHMDQPHNIQIGDGSSDRWYVLSNVEVN